MQQFSDIYRNKTVLITGHTGFKGTWLSFWLSKLGAKVIGYSKDIPTNPSHFESLTPEVESVFGDLLDTEKLNSTLNSYQPDIIFHLAAQTIVRASYQEPLETIQTNVLGTTLLLEAVRKSASVKALINVTSDKCYENKEQSQGYREGDSLGGFDPYSASKGCSEILTSSYIRSFFNPEKYGSTHQTLVASARAGNVIGGGDWCSDRLVPDIMRAFADNQIVSLRNPEAVRPWQHVLDPLSGYLLLGARLLEGKTEFSGAWNFGPADMQGLKVSELTSLFKEALPELEICFNPGKEPVHEASLLHLDCSKAHRLLNWHPVWNAQRTVKQTADWYQNFYKGVIKTELNLQQYCDNALENRAVWIERA